MCGIVGFQGNFSERLLGGMSNCVKHRGPDSSGQLILNPGDGVRVGFAHRRLAIIDLSPEGNQPMTTQCQRCGSQAHADLALIYNGEIYNFKELRAELVAEGHTFRSKSDSEVLLHLYARSGPEMLSRLNGIFAFAIFDGRENGRGGSVARGDVFIARDQLGIKPLYYAAVGGGVLFASELKALLQSSAVSREIDLVALHQHLAYLWTPAPRTILKGVKKLKPGYALLLRKGRIADEWSYYDVPYGQAPIDGSEEAIAAELNSRVRLAVERQMMSDVPLGAFLSGGLDSSAVVAMMKKVESTTIPICYTISFGDQEAIEGSVPDLPYARRVAQHLGVELREIGIRVDAIDELEVMLKALDEPQADPAPINALLIARQARRDGLKVLLSGAGGDDIFSGYRRHQAVRAERLWGGLPKGARGFLAGVARRAALSPWIRTRDTVTRRLVKMFEHADLPDDERLVAHFWWSGEALRRSLYSDSFAAAVGDELTATPLLETLSRLPQERDPLNRMLYLDTKHFLADHNLNYTDKMGMAEGVEVRVPLLDLELVEFAARIPSHLKQNGLVGKYIFKRAMENELPKDVIYREKTGFGAPLRLWLQTRLRERVDDTLSRSSLRRRGLFDPDAVRRLIELDREGRVDGAYTIFALMCFELWCRLFVDQPAVD